MGGEGGEWEFRGKGREGMRKEDCVCVDKIGDLRDKYIENLKESERWRRERDGQV